MKKDEYISISEFSKRAGVNRSYIYKLLSTKLKPFCLLVDNKQMLKTQALELFNVSKVDTEETDGDTLKELIEILQEQQATLKAELDIKNEQIRALHTANTQQLQLIDQQQKLQALSEQKRLEITERPKQDSLLNGNKFSTRTEYGEYLRKLLPNIGMFSGRKEKQELLKVLELMNEEERELVNEHPRTREAIEFLKNRDIDKFERDMKEAEEEANHFRDIGKKMRDEIYQQNLDDNIK